MSLVTSTGAIDPRDEPVLPTQTGDDLDTGWGEGADRDVEDSDERYRRERPPHHGD